MRNRKTLSLVIIILALILLVFLVYLTFFSSKPEIIEPGEQPDVSGSGQLPPSEEQIDLSINPGDKPREYELFDISKEAPHQTNQNDLAKIAKSIAELYGSFSNYSNYSNYADLKIMMTEEMKTWVDRQVANLKNNATNDTEYYGITTKALGSEVLEYDERAGTAKILVHTQRSESTTYLHDNANSAYSQDVEIGFKKISNRWLVDSAYWRER